MQNVTFRPGNPIADNGPVWLYWLLLVNVSLNQVDYRRLFDGTSDEPLATFLSVDQNVSNAFLVEHGDSESSIAFDLYENTYFSFAILRKK